MAKCSICKSKKGKRKCKADNTLICSLCCGQSRSQEKCASCTFYSDISLSRNYRKVPFYGISQMSGSIERENIGNVIESALCSMECKSEGLFQDKDAMKILELIFDKYHFRDEKLQFADTLQKRDFQHLIEVCEHDLPSTPPEVLLKVMAAIYRSIQRRTNGNREYLQFVEQYVGLRVISGDGIINS